MTTVEEARAARDAKLDALHEQLTGAVESLVSGEDWKRALEFAARFRARSFNNTLLIFVQHQAAFESGRVPEPVPSYVAGFKQWQALGRQVSRGQSGYMILAPVTGRFASFTPKVAESWRRLGRFEKPKPGEAVRSRMVGVRPAYVWDVSQTAGDPIPAPPSPRLLEGEAPDGLWEGIARLVEAEGFSVLRVPHEGMIHGANGLTDFGARSVAVRENMPEAAQVKTLVHELAHVLLHGPDNVDATGHRGIGEVEADSVALMVAAAHGMDTSDYTVPYVSGWAATVPEKSPVEVVQATGERVRKTAASILDQLPTVQIGNGDPPGLTRDAPANKRSDPVVEATADPLAEGPAPRGGVVGEEPVMGAADLFTEVGGMPLSEAAARFAAAGVPVFPCLPGEKRPLVLRGFHDATADPAQVAEWWSRWPSANIGIPTGAVSGVEVVDVDVHPTGTGFPAFREAHRQGHAAGWAALVRTPSGGLHAYYPVNPDRAQSSWQAARAHVDFRGDGGYIIAPPSKVLRPGGVRAAYRLIVASGDTPVPVDAVRLREFLDPRTPISIDRVRAARFERRGSDAKVLAGWVAGRGEGERNRGLFWAACRLAESGTPLDATLDALGPAAEHAGLGPREIMATIRSAYRTTHLAPRTSVEPVKDERRVVRGSPGRVIS